MFSNWKNQGIEVHVFARISKESVYPVSIYFGKVSSSKAVPRVITNGNGFILADRWYDVNDVYRIVYKKGYIPLIKPQRTRGRGYWRGKEERFIPRNGEGTGKEVEDQYLVL
ncbi:MAG: hypothetical protein DRN24_04800 [Thermoplasmata archaeon]|nr:MAG: hypothetical protein DRN24_04800 [Thermoplasmata archaeon]